MDADIRVAGPTNENQVMDRAWMPGTEIWAVPDTAMNPVVFHGRAGWSSPVLAGDDNQTEPVRTVPPPPPHRS